MSIAIPIPRSNAPRPVAPTRHTLFFLFYLLVVTVAAASMQHGRATSSASSVHPNTVPLYLSIAAAEWTMAWFAWRGLARAGVSLREVIGRGGGAAGVARDAVIASATWGVWKLAGLVFERLSFGDHPASVSALLPRTPAEIAAWVLLSITAGCCEELVYRGYFQRQFTAWTGHAWLGLALQAVLFGASHAYQGFAACARIVFYGVLFGSVALWRRSLRPGIIAHAATDILAGLFQV